MLVIDPDECIDCSLCRPVSTWRGSIGKLFGMADEFCYAIRESPSVDLLATSTRVDRVPESENQAIAFLEQIAGLTYAPATEAFRLSGARAAIYGNN